MYGLLVNLPRVSHLNYDDPTQTKTSHIWWKMGLVIYTQVVWESLEQQLQYPFMFVWPFVYIYLLIINISIPKTPTFSVVSNTPSLKTFIKVFGDQWIGPIHTIRKVRRDFPVGNQFLNRSRLSLFHSIHRNNVPKNLEKGSPLIWNVVKFSNKVNKKYLVQIPVWNSLWLC